MIQRIFGHSDRMLLALSVFVAGPLLALATTTGCSTTKGAAGDASRAAADVALPAREEEKLGKKFSSQVEKEQSLHPDKEVQQYIRNLGQKAVKAAGKEAPKPIDFEFHVIDAPNTINAFAGPGGQIYFYSGLLKEAETAAEVMSVMCHEVAHVTNRHIAQRLVVAHGADALASAALGDKPGLVERLATQAVTQGFLLKYSRDHERQADASGFSYIVRTSYDPRGFIDFFQRLQGRGSSPPAFLSSHPSPKERIETLKAKIESRGNLPTDKGKKRHQAIVDRLDS